MAQIDPEFKRWHKALKNFINKIENLSSSVSKVKLNILLFEVAQNFGYENEQRIAEIIKKSQSLENESLYNYILQLHGLKGEEVSDPRSSAEQEEDAVLFITTHSVKGLQRKVIFVLGMEKGNFPQPKIDIEEQRRLCYVSMTRAKELLFLCCAKKREGKSAKGFSFFDKSQFIYEIPQQYRESIMP